MGVKTNMEAGNYGIASKLIEMLLPLNLVDKGSLEHQLLICKENHSKDFVRDHNCIQCNNQIFSGSGKCPNCSTPIIICHQSLRAITEETYLNCEYCHANLSNQESNEQNLCSFCNCGMSTLKQKSSKVL